MKNKKTKIPAMLTLAESGSVELPKDATCSGVAYSGGEFQQWWSDDPCYLDLAGMEIARQIPIMFNHDYDPYCRLGEATIDNDGHQLMFAGTLDGTSKMAQRMIEQGKKYEWQVSMGAENKAFELLPDKTATEINGRTILGPAVIVRKSLLREISLVSLGADAETSMTIKASLLAPEMPGDEAVDDTKAGLDAAPENDAQEPAVAPEAKPEETPEEPVNEPPEPENDPSEPSEAGSIELKPKNSEEIIMNEELMKQLAAITAGLEALNKRVEATEVKADRPAPEISIKNDSDVPVADVLQAGIEQAMGIRQADTKAAELADKKYHSQLGLRQLYTECARNAGWDGYLNSGNMGEAVSAIKAGFSTVNLPGILGNAINKRIREGFDYVDRSWEKIASVTSVSDYKKFSTYSLNSTGEYEEVPNGGSITGRGALSETSYDNQLKRYGMMFQIDEMDIINDDMSAINAKAFGLGRKAALKLNEVLWTLFQNDSAFFTGANLLDANGELNMANLAKLNKAFKDQKDAEGHLLGIQPSILLVPTALEVTANKLYNDTELRDTNANKTYLTGNPWQHKFQPVASPYLTNDDNYYLLADPKVAATLQVAFLNGQSAPVIESQPADFDVFGIQYRGKFSFGVAFADKFAGIKAVKGA